MYKMKKTILKSVVFFICVLTNFSLKAQSNHPFLNPPKIISDPGNYYKYSEESRKFTGIPSIAIAPNGRMWATWYAGPTPNEDDNNYIVLATSENSGKSWEEILIVDPDGRGPVRAFDPEVWISPDNKLWLFWSQSIMHDGTIAGVWAINTKDVENKHPNWSEPKRFTDGIMMCKPTVLKNGDWTFPVSTWMNTDNSAKVFLSTDQGKTWNFRGACDVPKQERIFDEHMIVEKSDGSLWMCVRIRSGIGESFSHDGGKTWSEMKPMPIKNPSSRFFIRRLRSGNLLLVKNGPMDYLTNRSHLMAFISKDDGKTWSKGLLLDEREAVSYPDGQQVEDGTIYITYDYNRYSDQQICITNFTEEDILAEDYDVRITKVQKNRKTVSKGGL